MNVMIIKPITFSLVCYRFYEHDHLIQIYVSSFSELNAFLYLDDGGTFTCQNDAWNRLFCRVGLRNIAVLRISSRIHAIGILISFITVRITFE